MTSNSYYQEPGPKVVSEEHQVFTLGAQNREWKMIECKHPHLPSYQTIMLCKDGVVYYYAWIGMERCLISFDVRTEDFNVIKLPEDVRLLNYSNLVNYNGKIAVTSDSFNGRLDLRILEDVSKQEWSKFSVLVPSWRDLVGDNTFWFKGALRTGELIFAPRSSIEPFYIICYDLKDKNARKVVIEGIGGDGIECTQVFLDHVESPMFLTVS